METQASKVQSVAFQGELGAFSNQAARELLPHCEAVPKQTFDDAISAVQSGETDFAIIPIENSLHGRIADIHRILPDAGLFIVGEHFLPIHLQLLGLKTARLEDIRTIVSQGPALGQCRRLIKERNLKTEPWYDTAGSALHVSQLEDPTKGAIASSLAGEIYGLSVLKRDVEDELHNTTRFLILAPKPYRIRKDMRPVVTTFVFRVGNMPAALFKALGGFATNGVNMTKLESYQLGGTFNATQFYADIDGHPDDGPVQFAFEELRLFTSQLTVLGTYPAHAFRETLAKLPTIHDR